MVFTSRDVAQYVYCSFLFPGCNVINFKINIIFLIESYFYMTKKSRQKFKYLEDEKGFRAFN